MYIIYTILTCGNSYKTSKTKGSIECKKKKKLESLNN